MRTNSSKVVYENPWMSVREDAIARADGSEGVYGVIDKPTYALVIAVHEGKVQLVEQYRYPLGARFWEFPQGTAPDRVELDPLELAQRELKEETGLTAESWTELGELAVAAGMSSQRGRAYLAQNVSFGSTQREHEEADMTTRWFTIADFEDMVHSGDVIDAQSIAAWALYLLRGRLGTQ
jgi:8-oxo-dGTP pyrophosphatase MutT (NUDIX family)